jgi:DNA-binding GntR family transcriptional regulator
LGKVSDQVYNVLRRQIMKGQFAPRTKIKEHDVAEELGVSRTPVRTALQRLVADGLLRSGPKRGAMTIEWTEEDVREIFELRASLEGISASYAARYCGAQALEELIAQTDQMERLWRDRPIDYLPQLQQVNFRFHRLMLTESRRPRVRDLALNLMDIPMTIGGFYLYTDADMARSIQHHRDLTAALEARDESWARTAMENHLMASLQVFLRTQVDHRKAEGMASAAQVDELRDDA